ncbi:uncharacterized protein LOC120105126 [Phoenix dactylifera]|uniref:Uncharacterized protein LOC120105126 n=1 Tax=Phoenix dactylifera TaxID=42345 RepID=A0A8B8ZNU3_PHODC|nr:uncharacterized protein LOC120105126 [Phoenix dactylifera]
MSNGQGVDKLLEAGFIQEISYPKWLASVVLVRKASGKWRMCVDYTDLNKRKFLIVSIDYFTKWVEAEPVAQITEQKMRDFVWKFIICRFGLLHILISDNGHQFDNACFREFCLELGIDHCFTSVAHPQANEKTEVTNRTILQGLKIRLDQSKGQWVEDLYNVLWAYRTTFRVPTGETPFNLTYGMEAVIPLEIELPSPRVECYDADSSATQLRSNLDLIEQTREAA